jgi:hypothetical protein
MKGLATSALGGIAVLVACNGALTNDDEPIPATPSGAIGADASFDAPSDVHALPDTSSCAKQVAGPGRLTATACDVRERPAGDAANAGASDGGVDECAGDGDCSAGTNGRCNVLRGDNLPKHLCTYDACMQDSDCGSRGVCGCGLGFAGQNVCLSNSNCRVNADCARGERCSLSIPYFFNRVNVPIQTGREIIPKGFGANTPFDEALGYFCTTLNDTCDQACNGPTGQCTFDYDSNHWGWGYAP